MRKFRLIFLWWLTVPHVIAYFFSSKKAMLNEDIDWWLICTESTYVDHRLKGLCWLLLDYPEFRNIFYLRLGPISFVLRWLSPLSSLYICTRSEDFGPGVFIQHGFATIIGAEHIGRKCWINQQVTIGYNNSKKYGYGKPWIGDNVRISAGAKICGKIRIGDNTIIGINAVVVKDVPENSTIVPSPMIMICENGVSCKKTF